MRPPATRPLRVQVSASLLARRVVLDLTALVVAALMLHAALTAAGASGALVTFIAKIAGPLSWPAGHLPGVEGHRVVADVATLTVALIACAVVVGVIAGYAAEARGHQPPRHDRV